MVIPPIERLIQKMSQAEIQEAVRAELISQEQAAAAATQVSNKGKGEQMDRLLARLTNLENDYLDREISRDRYRLRRDEINNQLQDIEAQMVVQPKAVLPDMEQLFAIAESININNLDTQAWRQLVAGMVDRIVAENPSDGHKNPPTIVVQWKREYENLIAELGGDVDEPN